MPEIAIVARIASAGGTDYPPGKILPPSELPNYPIDGKLEIGFRKKSGKFVFYLKDLPGQNQFHKPRKYDPDRYSIQIPAGGSQSTYNLKFSLASDVAWTFDWLQASPLRLAGSSHVGLYTIIRGEDDTSFVLSCIANQNSSDWEHPFNLYVNIEQESGTNVLPLRFDPDIDNPPIG